MRDMVEMLGRRYSTAAASLLACSTLVCVCGTIAGPAAGAKRIRGLCAYVPYQDVRQVAPGLRPEFAQAHDVVPSGVSRLCGYSGSKQKHPSSSLISRPPFLNVVQERLSFLYRRTPRLDTGRQVVEFVISGTQDTQRVRGLGNYGRVRWKPSPSPETGGPFFEAVWVQGDYEYSVWIGSATVTRASGLRFCLRLAARMPR